MTKLYKRLVEYALEVIEIDRQYRKNSNKKLVIDRMIPLTDKCVSDIEKIHIKELVGLRDRIKADMIATIDESYRERERE